MDYHAALMRAAMPAPTKKVQTMITEKDVLDRLSKVKGPDLEGDIVSLGMVGGIQIDGDIVVFFWWASAITGKFLKQKAPLPSN